MSKIKDGGLDQHGKVESLNGIGSERVKLNKIVFKRTKSLSNAVCFKHENNVCACAVSALILFPVVNLSLEMDSAASISY